MKISLFWLYQSLFCSFISLTGAETVAALNQAQLFEQYNFPPPNATVVDYDWNITHSVIAPDGKFRSGFLINGQQPGPAITVNEGDWVRVHLKNLLPIDVSIHFHGILQHGTPWADGVSGVTQYPILSGDDYTHVFQAVNQSGGYWYHAHYRGYENDGVVGPIYVIPADDVPRPYEEIPGIEDLDSIYELEKNPVNIVLTDWFKWSMDDILARTYAYGVASTCIQSILFNGKGRVTCHSTSDLNTAGASRLAALGAVNGSFDSMGCYPVGTGFSTNTLSDLQLMEAPGYSAACVPTTTDREIIYTNNQPWIYANLFNMGGEFNKVFSIDDHPFYVVSVDGTFIEPLYVYQLQVAIGSRYTILIKADPSEHSDTSLPFAIRASSDEIPQVIDGMGYFVYGTANTTNETYIQSIADPINGFQIQDIGGSLLSSSYNETKVINTSPYDLDFVPPSGNADITVNYILNVSGPVGFSMFANGVSMPGQMELDEPLLYRNDINSSIDFSQIPAVVDPGIELGDVVDFIFDNTRIADHPIHFHGHYVYIVSQSTTEAFPYATVAEAQAANYSALIHSGNPRVDVFPVPSGGHTVVRFLSDNPGFWALHCHIISHQVGGMMAIIVEANKDIPPVPSFLLQQGHSDYVLEDYVISELPFDQS